ncbi:hypothetical protein [Chryseobacterium sp. G0201]|uniref:hypothetical protein n=1 Tax=Chryseobacterium sp. G0201 TaxID=2487065 RepID=UPI000F51713A|nr:hypothetical protein [Chryseobacterium sp. G0201]AZA54571.1 hypothetical protein EG348_17005 [Chryseobacterium sp. G0201]
MDTSYYLEKFQEAADKLDKRLLTKKHVESAVVLYGKDCVVLKLYKRSWTNQFQDPLISKSRIFFSVWISDSSIKEEKLLYNIHALKLRQLKGYSIESRKFADIFRDSFKLYKNKWKNVSLDFGPLTLMEGWLKIDIENFQDEIIELANNFIEIEHLVDVTLAHFK